MTDSSVPAAYTYILGLAEQVAAGASVKTIVSDGWPEEQGPSMFAVGCDEPPDADSGQMVTGTAGILTLGQMSIQENYGIPCWIYSSAGGVAQASVRNASFALWSAFVDLLRADPFLGGTVTGPAQINNFSYRGPKTADEAGGGRYGLILFTVSLMNIY